MQNVTTAKSDRPVDVIESCRGLVRSCILTEDLFKQHSQQLNTLIEKKRAIVSEHSERLATLIPVVREMAISRNIVEPSVLNELNFETGPSAEFVTYQKELYSRVCQNRQQLQKLVQDYQSNVGQTLSAVLQQLQLNEPPVLDARQLVTRNVPELLIPQVETNGEITSSQSRTRCQKTVPLRKDGLMDLSKFIKCADALFSAGCHSLNLPSALGPNKLLEEASESVVDTLSVESQDSVAHWCTRVLRRAANQLSSQTENLNCSVREHEMTELTGSIQSAISARQSSMIEMNSTLSPRYSSPASSSSLSADRRTSTITSPWHNESSPRLRHTIGTPKPIIDNSVRSNPTPSAPTWQLNTSTRISGILPSPLLNVSSLSSTTLPDRPNLDESNPKPRSQTSSLYRSLSPVHDELPSTRPKTPMPLHHPSPGVDRSEEEVRRVPCAPIQFSLGCNIPAPPTRYTLPNPIKYAPASNSYVGRSNQPWMDFKEEENDENFNLLGDSMEFLNDLVPSSPT